MRSYLTFAVRHRRFLGFGFTLLFFSSFGQTFFLSLFSAEIRGAFGLSHGSFGSLYSLATLASGLTMLWLGRQIDRHELPRFTLGVCAGLVAAAFLMAWTPTVPLLVVALFTMRLTGQGLMGHTSSTSMARYFEAGRGKAISIATLGLPAGEATLPPIAVAVSAAIGWRTTWVVFALAIAVVLVPLVSWLLRGHSERHLALQRGQAVDAAPAVPGQERVEPRRFHWTQRQVVGDARFWLVVPSITASAFLMTGFFFHQVHLVETKGWSLQWYSLCFSAFAATQVGSGLVAGPLVDRFGAPRLLPFYLVPLALAFLVLASLSHPATALGYLLLAGLSAGSSATVGSALWAEAYGTVHLGAIRAMVSAMFVLSTAASPVLMGQLIDAGVTMDALARLGALYLVVAAGVGSLAFRGNVQRAP
ncbi:MAG TPA: MFS transporter, partial [bacterium]|nr:MFS transporter [bacterium]